MKKILTYKGTVFAWECDTNRHMNVMYYVNKFENGGHQFTHDMGLSPLLKKEEIGIVVLQQNLKYLKEVFEDDILHVESTLLEIGNKSFRILHEMYDTRTNELVSSMDAVFVLFDKINRKAILFPEDIRKDLLDKM